MGTFLSVLMNGLVQRGRLFLGMVGAIAMIGGAWSMYSATTHSLNGVNTSAVLVERFAKCQAEFQPKGESRRREAMDCKQAHAFREAAGSRKVRVHTSNYATVRYALSDGSSRTATVYEGKVETRGLPVGSTFGAVYDPANPGDVRAQPTLSSVGFNLAMLLGGLGMLGLALLPQVMGLFGRGASRSTAESRDADAAAWGEDTLKEAVARNQPAAQRMNAVASGPVARSTGVAGARRQFGMRGA